MKVPNVHGGAIGVELSLSRLQNEGSQPCYRPLARVCKSIKATE